MDEPVGLDAIRSLEQERVRLTALLAATHAHIQALTTEKLAREEAVKAFALRARRGEAWKKGEHEGVLARNAGVALDANPHLADAVDEAERDAHLAWRHGWRMREALLDLSEALRVAREEAGRAQAGLAAAAEREAALVAVRAERDALAARVGAAEAEAASQAARSEKLQALVARIVAEAPHSPTCARWAEGGGTTACSCWRSRVTGAPQAKSPPPEGSGPEV